MEIKIINAEGAYTHLALVGKLDMAGVSEIEDQFIGLTAARKKNALVDISGVTFTGSMGLRLFLRTSRSLSGDHKSLVLLNPQPLVDKVFVESGIKDVILVEHDAEAALAKVTA